MKKETLKTFIERYSIGGEISKVKWKYTASTKTLHARATADGRYFIADVILKNFSDFGNEDIVICIGDTDKVKAMITPFAEDINFSINKSDSDKVLGFTLSDADCESYCAAADASIIDPVPKNLQDIPNYDAIVPLTEEFLEKFLKARGALKDVSMFSVAMNKKNLLEVVIGYVTANSNRIRLTPTCDAVYNKVNVAMSFPVKNVAEVFKANKDISNASMNISDAGIIKLSFESNDYTCSYYQFANKKS
jgi:hypothetical protein